MSFADIKPEMDINYVDILPDASHIYEGLYQGSFPREGKVIVRATNTIIEDWSLTVSLSRLPQARSDSYIHFPFHDGQDIPNQTILKHVVNLVTETVRDGKYVLVHCDAGLNRSGLVCALTLIKLGFKPQDAVSLLRKQRCNEVLYNRVFYDYVLEQRDV